MVSSCRSFAQLFVHAKLVQHDLLKPFADVCRAFAQNFREQGNYAAIAVERMSSSRLMIFSICSSVNSASGPCGDTSVNGDS
jgi:hypothetical protein